MTEFTFRPRSVVAVLLLLPAMALAACGTGGDSSTGRPLVVATTAILGDVTAAVAGVDVDVEVLVPAGADPHDYQASARQAARLRDADLVLAVGLSLEEGLLDVLAAAADDGVRVVYLAELLDPIPVVDPDLGGDADALDPHVWMDPVRMQTAATIIAEELAGLGGGAVAERVAAYVSELERLADEIDTSVAGIPADRRILVVDHYSLGYYADRFGLEVVGTVAPASSSSAETSAAGFAELLEVIRDLGIPVLFTSVGEPSPVARSLADEAGIPVVELWTGSLGGTGSGAETYLDMMRLTTSRIVAGLTGSGS